MFGTAIGKVTFTGVGTGGEGGGATPPPLPNILGRGTEPPFVLQPSIVTTQISKYLPGLIMSKCASIAAKSIPFN